jgi:transposase
VGGGTARGKQRTDSTHVLAKIRAINRLVCVGETLRHALNCLAMVAPEWLLEHSQPEWVDRYGVRLEDSRLPLRRRRSSGLGPKRRARWE